LLFPSERITCQKFGTVRHYTTSIPLHNTIINPLLSAIMRQDTTAPTFRSFPNSLVWNRLLKSQMVPKSRPEHEGKHSLCTTIPWELREKIWAYTMELSGVPYLYSYTGLPAESLSAAPDLPLADGSMADLQPLACAVTVPCLPQSPIENPPKEQTGVDVSMQNLIGDEKHSRRMRERHRRELLYQQQILNANDSDVEALIYDWELLLERALKRQKHSRQESSLPSVTRTHSMMLVNKELGREYRCVYYERTSFFFHLNHSNMARGLYSIGSEAYDYRVQPLPDFWQASPELFSGLRHCTLYVELSAVELLFSQNGEHPQCFTTHPPIIDAALTSAVHTLIRYMPSLTTLQLV
jgi:hypothetical protein